jgi:hypothetical protein
VPVIGLLDGPLNMAWSSGQASSAEVPLPYMISINGHNYLEDLEFKPWKRQAMRATTTQTTRTQADTSNEPGEQSLSTESLWRRTQDSWHIGAGQVFLDRKNSSEFSFRTSAGVNPWTQWQLTCLPSALSAFPSANTNLYLVSAGSRFYFTTGQQVWYTNDFSSWLPVSGTPAQNVSSITTDGFNVYMAYGASGVYITNTGTGAATQYVTTALASTAIVRYVLGRLMVANNNSIYNVIATGALPAALFTSNYAQFIWTDFTGGNGVIFACGNSGNQGIIYSIQINTDATSLSAPIICGQLPIGETVNTVYGYAGSAVFIGTNLGWRFSEQALANGVAGTVALTIGPLFPMNPVNAFAGYGRFVWGTQQAVTSTSSGLFRVDPTNFVSDLAPAYANDLTWPVLGQIPSVAFYGSRIVFTMAGTGLIAQPAAGTFPQYFSGQLDSGLITYGLADKKVPVYVDLSFLPLPSGASIQTLVSIDGGPFQSIGIANAANTTSAEFQTPQTPAETIEIREILSPGNVGGTGATTPTLTRHTLRSIPAPATPTDWTVVVQLRERVMIQGGLEVPLVPSTEYAYLENLRANKTISILQVGNMGPYTITVESIDWIPELRGSSSGEVNGVCVLTCRTVV